MEETTFFGYLRWIPALPLIGFLVNIFSARGETGHGRASRVHWIACLAPFGSFLIALLSFSRILELAPEARRLTDTVFTWIAAGNFTANLSFSMDPLSAVMTLVVTGVGFLIHVYSVGYMHGDRAYARYFAYLNLFMAMMLLLVLGDNLLLLCERRLDNIVWKSGLARTRAQARQSVAHGHVAVNGRRTSVPSFVVSPDDVISVRKRDNLQKVYAARAEEADRPQAGFLAVERKELVVKMIRLPDLEDIGLPVNVSQVVEFLSR